MIACLLEENSMKKITGLLLSLFSITTFAGEIITSVNGTSSTNAEIGKVVFTDTPYGLLITPAFTSLPPGTHGFHLHQNANCGDMGMSAGGHFDPKSTNSHKGPYGEGHLGDLPVLFVGSDGQANTPLLAPRLKTTDLHGLAIMIHAGGDNYSDTPPLGGGGARYGCGVIA